MKPTITEKADQMVRNDKIQVECIGQLNDRVFYKVGSGDNQVKASMVGEELISCTCKAHSIKVMGADCSFVLAIKKFRRKK